MAIIKVRNPAIDLDAAEIPNLDASKITTGTFDASRIGSGTFADARISSSSVTQHSTPFDDNKIVNDISTLALRQASDQNKSAYNTNSQFVDVFQDDTGIDTETNVDRNTSEYVSSHIINFSTPSFITSDQSSVYSFSYSGFSIDGSYPLNATTVLGTGSTDAVVNHTWYFDPNGQSVSSSMYLSFDLGSGNSKIFTGARQIQKGAEANTLTGCGTWQWQLSNDGSTWTNFGNTFIWGSASGNPSNTEVTWDNDDAYRYIRVIGVGGATSNQRWQDGFHFQTKTLTDVFNSTGNFTGTTITAPSSVSSMGAIITYQDASGTNALNTDIVLQLSADGGSNYSTATLTALPNFATGIKMAKVNDLAVTAGTNLKYKISFANQASGTKEARIRGVALQY